MVNQREAEESVNRYLRRREKNGDIPCEVIQEYTEQFDGGWVVYYAPKRFRETGDQNYLVGGNYPIIVDKNDGVLFSTGPRAVQYYCDLFQSDKSRLVRLSALEDD